MANSFKVITTSLLLLLLLTTANSLTFAQKQQRVLLLSKFKWSTNGKAIEIVEVRVSGKPVELEKPFTAEDKWLEKLTVKVRNISGKPVRSINMGFSLLDTSLEGKQGIGFSFSYGTPCSDKTKPPCNVKDENLRLIMPNQEIDMRFKFGVYTRTKALALKRTGVSVFKQVLIGHAVVQFEDGTLTISQELTSDNLPKNNTNQR